MSNQSVEKAMPASPTGQAWTEEQSLNTTMSSLSQEEATIHEAEKQVPSLQETAGEDNVGQDNAGEDETGKSDMHSSQSDNFEGQKTQSEASAGFFEIVRKYASISDLLRLSGAIAVATAMGLFLLDGIQVVNDLQRFLTMLGLTSALTAAGLAMSTILKEQRGSRVFISLALLSVPVNFTVFGALLYSLVPLDAMALSYPGYAHWQAGSVSDLALGLVAGLAVLGPVIWFGYSVLARSARHWLSMALIASSAILVIPVRAELWSAGLAIGSTILLWMACKRYSSGSLALKTTEGKLAIALLFVAPVIVAARSLFFYDVNGVLVLVLSTGFLVYCRQLLIGVTRPGALSNALSSLLTLLNGAAILGVCYSTGDLLVNFFPEAWVVFSVSIGLLLLTNDLLRVSPNPVMSGVIGLIFAGVSTLALVATTVFWSGMTLWVALALIAIVAWGSYFRINLVALLGVIGLVGLVSLNASELLFHAKTMWTTVLMTGWWGVAAIGALAIVAGSMIDRAGTVVEVKS